MQNRCKLQISYKTNPRVLKKINIATDFINQLQSRWQHINRMTLFMQNNYKFHLADEVSKATPRVPQKQLVIEMAALIKEQMSAVMNTSMRPVIRPLPKFR